MQVRILRRGQGTGFRCQVSARSLRGRQVRCGQRRVDSAAEFREVVGYLRVRCDAAATCNGGASWSVNTSGKAPCVSCHST